MRIIDPGELKNSIEIQRLVPGTDKENRPCNKWEAIINTRAKILNVRGDEFTQAYGTGSKIAKTFYIRAPRNEQVTNEDRILYKGTPFNIIYVNDIEERGIYLEIKAELTE
ncbi:phage head closure protein [Clostridium baratii]|uniref:phage head closure protein n=1 Tax=Clostridium baratii TaxID=1561 RepID=UPI0030D4E57A